MSTEHKNYDKKTYHGKNTTIKKRHPIIGLLTAHVAMLGQVSADCLHVTTTQLTGWPRGSLWACAL